MDILESDVSFSSDFDDDYKSDNEGNNIVIPNSDPQPVTHVIWSQPRGSFTP